MATQLQQEINRLKTLQESYSEMADSIAPLTALDSDIAAGKQALATAITAKGVTTAATDTMVQMADNVSQIAQSSIEVDGGDMYAKQLFGSLTTPNYWNLYEVMAQLLSDGRLVNYGGILLAEYYKGYDSLALSGAGAGGAYVVSDKDSNGNFIMYTNDTTHTWDTNDDGKGNRWVAYCFADAGHEFVISDTNTSPRSIYIGRHVGVIRSTVATRISEIVCTDGNVVDDIRLGGFTNNFGKRTVVRNIENHNYGTLFGVASPTECIYLSVKNVSEMLFSLSFVVPSIIINGIGGQWNCTGTALIYQGGANYLEVTNIASLNGSFRSMNIGEFLLNADHFNYIWNTDANPTLFSSTCKKVYIIGEGGIISAYRSTITDLLYIGYKDNDYTKSLVFIGEYVYNTHTLRVELKDGWRKNLNIARTSQYLTAENIALDILDKLAPCTSETGQLTLQIGATNLATIQNDPDYSSYLTDAIDNKGWSVIA